MYRAPQLKKDRGIYGKTAYRYARWTSGDRVEYRKLAELVARNSKEGDNILEVAPGPGYTVIELAKLGNFTITAMDISKTFVEIGSNNAEKAGVKVQFIEGNVSHMPFPDNQFHIIFNRAAFKNFKEPVKALMEMRRVLKPGGRALIQDLRPDINMKTINAYVSKMDSGPFQKLMQKIIFRYFLTRTAHSKEEFEEFISKAGYSEFHINDQDSLGYEIWLTK